MDSKTPKRWLSRASTSFGIMHLLDEIEWHDQVVFLEKSQIKEQGTFAELGGAQGIKSKFVAKEELLQL